MNKIAILQRELQQEQVQNGIIQHGYSMVILDVLIKGWTPNHAEVIGILIMAMKIVLDQLMTILF